MDSRGYVMALEEAEARLKAVTERLTRERDEAIEERDAADTALQLALVARDEARAALRQVEWAGEFGDCPACGRSPKGGPASPAEGHAEDCPLKAALEE